MFEVYGIVNNKEQKIIYSNDNGVGIISGDEMICFIVEDALKSKSSIGPVGQYMERDINNPLATLFVIIESFDKIINTVGDIPTADDIPEGFIS